MRDPTGQQEHGAEEVSGARVLVVDDEPVILDILKDFLEYEGFEVSIAPSGEDALRHLKSAPFDALLTDLKMPGLSGLQLLRSMREANVDAVSIMMTGFGTVESAIEAMKQGAFDYILKPFKPDDVVRVLRRGLEQRRLTRENLALRQLVGFYELSETLSSSKPLSEQLEVLLGMVIENFGADRVAILIEDPSKPGQYVERACRGKDGLCPDTSRVIERLRSGENVLAHGAEVQTWLHEGGDSVQSFMSVPLKSRGELFGVVSAFSVEPGHRFSEGQRKGLAVFAAKAAKAIENTRMHESLRETFTQTMEGFARAIEAKDTYTHGHSDRVATYAKRIAVAMGLVPSEVEKIHHGGVMHDIGKIGIRSHDLNKPQKLTPAEYMMFKSHPVQGKRIIEPIGFLAHLIPCVYHHHEAWDGSGYPEGIGGTDIPLEARILAIADSYDAMTSNRPYRKALPHDIAIAEFKRCAGRQFDPQVVAAFLVAIEILRRERREQGLPVPD